MILYVPVQVLGALVALSAIAGLFITIFILIALACLSSRQQPPIYEKVAIDVTHAVTPTPIDLPPLPDRLLPASVRQSYDGMEDVTPERARQAVNNARSHRDTRNASEFQWTINK